MRNIFKVWRFLSLIMAIIASGCYPKPDFLMPIPTSTPSSSRQIAGNTLSLHEYWRMSQVYRGGADRVESGLLAVTGRVIYLAIDSVEDVDQVYVVDAMTGAFLWKTSEERVDYPMTDAEHLYLIQPGDTLQAYDLDDGQLLWKTPLMPRVFYNLYREEDALCVHNLDEAEILYIEPRTGAELRRVKMDIGEGERFLAHFPQFDLYTPRDVLRSVDPTTRRLLWETEIRGVNHVVTRPVLYRDRFLLVGDREVVTVVNTQTGDIQWDTRAQEDWLSSNFVVVGGSLYALDYQARLVRRDVGTGQETGYIQFTPERVDTTTNRYRVAVDGEMVFVFFSDSQELIALGP